MERNVKYSALLILLLPLLIAADLKLSWTPNTESDLAGYNVSYDGPASGRWVTPCGPYEYSSMGLVYNTTYTITDAAPGDYAFYVRAYDEAGNMSGYNAYAGTLSQDGEIYTWTTVGISEPDNCVPSPTITASHTAMRVPFRLSVQGQATNNPTSWEMEINGDAESVNERAYTYTTSGVRQIKLKAQNSTWYGVTWQEIEGIPVDSSTGRGGAGAGFR
jgi:PKD repeat protein